MVADSLCGSTPDDDAALAALLAFRRLWTSGEGNAS
jgi:hypothetical protein